MGRIDDDVTSNPVPSMDLNGDGVINGGNGDNLDIGQHAPTPQGKESQHLSDLVSKVVTLRCVVHDVIDLLKRNTSRLDGLHDMFNMLLTRVANIEHMLNPTTKGASTEPKHAPNSKDVPNVITTNNGSKGDQKSAVTPKINRARCPIPEDVLLINLGISSDEDDPKKGDNKNFKSTVGGNPNTRFASGLADKKVTSTIADIQPTYSNHLRGTSSKMKEKLSNTGQLSMVSRRLPFTCSPANRPLKIPKVEQNQEYTAKSNIGQSNKIVGKTSDSLKSYKPAGQIMSKFVKTNFRPTPEMELTSEQLHVAAYVFHPNKDPSEKLVKVDTFFGSRKDFQTLCPGRTIEREIVHMMAMKITWYQKHFSTKTVWSLPPSFARAVRSQSTVEDLVRDYADSWMPVFDDLKLVYVPIEDILGNWYLMVASIEDQMLYYMDPYFEDQNIYPRQDTIKNLWEVITQMMRTNHYPPDYINEVMQVDGWDISDPIGNVTANYCQHSAVWVLEWMDMDFAFQPNIHAFQNEDVVRMKVAMGLLMGDHNELKAEVQDTAEDSWFNMRYA